MSTLINRFLSLPPHSSADYDQQRKDLLRKHGIDLDDGAAVEPPVGLRAATRRMGKREVDRIMGVEAGDGGVFTWREKNRKKVSGGPPASRDRVDDCWFFFSIFGRRPRRLLNFCLSEFC